LQRIWHLCDNLQPSSHKCTCFSVGCKAKSGISTGVAARQEKRRRRAFWPLRWHTERQGSANTALGSAFIQTVAAVLRSVAGAALAQDQILQLAPIRVYNPSGAV